VADPDGVPEPETPPPPELELAQPATRAAETTAIEAYDAYLDLRESCLYATEVPLLVRPTVSAT
jgi:hypothetical protein